MMRNYHLAIPLLLATCGALLFFINSSDFNVVRRLSRSRLMEIKDRSGVRGRLKALGLEGSYEAFRYGQVSHSFWFSLVVFILFSKVQNSFFLNICISVLGGLVIFFFEDHKLSLRVTRQRLHVEAEFAPTIEMLTLAISAGETPLGAITRISQRSEGLLSLQFKMVVESVRSGKSFQVSLDEMGRRIESVQIRRFVDALATAMTRGAPLIDLLHIHVAEARSVQKNLIMDKAGKAEMSMMIPVVFLILPISIVFALWPSLIHLNLFAS